MKRQSPALVKTVRCLSDGTVQIHRYTWLQPTPEMRTVYLYAPVGLACRNDRKSSRRSGTFLGVKDAGSHAGACKSAWLRGLPGRSQSPPYYCTETVGQSGQNWSSVWST